MIMQIGCSWTGTVVEVEVEVDVGGAAASSAAARSSLGSREEVARLVAAALAVGEEELIFIAPGGEELQAGSLGPPHSIVFVFNAALLVSPTPPPLALPNVPAIAAPTAAEDTPPETLQSTTGMSMEQQIASLETRLQARIASLEVCSAAQRRLIGCGRACASASPSSPSSPRPSNRRKPSSSTASTPPR